VHAHDTGGYDAEVINTVCDYIYVMLYDAYYASTPYTGGAMGHTAPYSWAQSRMNGTWVSQQLDAAKTVIGLPAYSNLWNTHTVSGVIEGNQMRPTYKPDNVPPTWNATDRYNYYEWTQNNWLMKLYATDEQSTAELLTLMDQNGVREIAFWRFDLITPEMWNKIDEWRER
jgi:spore germination protein YaaH